MFSQLLVLHLLTFFKIFFIAGCSKAKSSKLSCFHAAESYFEDNSCDLEAIDAINNAQIYPKLLSLLSKDYFRFYKVNLKRKCLFWPDDSHCTIKNCHVEPCNEEDIPPGLKGPFRKDEFLGKKNEKGCQDYDVELGYLNTTISENLQKDFILWKTFDDAHDNFCVINENDNDAEYVDLRLNPERFTGYHGKSAHKVWNSIYSENCFTPNGLHSSLLPPDVLRELCLEKRVFYRAISGLHASINIHLCASYLKTNFGLPEVQWGPNLKEFIRRFSLETTNDKGPSWIRNLYFVFLLEVRALAKAAAYFEKEEFYTGNFEEDQSTHKAVQDLLRMVQLIPNHFNETNMFVGYESEKLKLEFKQHFRNISLIMDCVGCDKCKLWGKLQTQGLGTALKILFSENFKNNILQLSGTNKGEYRLQRTEVVSLINSIGRLSTSIYKLEEFRRMLINDK